MYIGKAVIVTVILVFLVSCRATKYEPEGYYGGYASTQLADDLYRVSFKGNSQISFNEASDYLLLRSAEIAAEQGYRYFMVVDKSSHIKNEQLDLPSYSQTTLQATSSGSSIYGTANTSTIPGGSVSLSKPQVYSVIRLLKEKPSEDKLYFDAVQLKSLLKAKYGI